MVILSLALDLRALQTSFIDALREIVTSEMADHFGQHVQESELTDLCRHVMTSITKSLDGEAIIMDLQPRMATALAASSIPLIDYFSRKEVPHTVIASITSFRSKVTSQACDLLGQLREEFLSGARGPAPASCMLGNTRPVYEYVRIKLGIKMHGTDNQNRFVDGFTEMTIGQHVSLIYEVGSISCFRPLSHLTSSVKGNPRRKYATNNCGDFLEVVAIIVSYFCIIRYVEMISVYSIPIVLT